MSMMSTASITSALISSSPPHRPALITPAVRYQSGHGSATDSHHHYCQGPLSSSCCPTCLTLPSPLRRYPTYYHAKRPWYLHSPHRPRAHTLAPPLLKRDAHAPAPQDITTLITDLCATFQNLHIDTPTTGHRWNTDPTLRYCSVCFLNFRTQNDLTRHLHTSRLHNQCGECGARFRSWEARKAHAEAECWRVCYWCGSGEHGEDGKSSNIRVEEWEGHIFEGGVAGEPKVSRKRMAWRKRGKGTGHWGCSICWREAEERGEEVWSAPWFRDEEGMKKHVRSKHGERWCFVCEDVVGEYQDREEHCEDNHVRCEVCEGKWWAGKWKLRRRWGKVWFTDKKVLGLHLKTWCHFCGTDCMDNIAKSLHLKVVHHWQCESCRFAPIKKGRCAVHEIQEGPTRLDMWSATLRKWIVIACTAAASMVLMASKAATSRTSSLFGTAGSESKEVDGLGELFEIIGIPADSSAAQIRKAARDQRIATHPDKVHRQQAMSEHQKEALEERSRQVGWAADILLDEEERERFLCEQEMRRQRPVKRDDSTLSIVVGIFLLAEAAVQLMTGQSVAKLFVYALADSLWKLIVF